MITPYRQKYNPKKPRSKIRASEEPAQVFFKKNFHLFRNTLKTNILVCIFFDA